MKKLAEYLRIAGKLTSYVSFYCYDVSNLIDPPKSGLAAKVAEILAKHHATASVVDLSDLMELPEVKSTKKGVN